MATIADLESIGVEFEYTEFGKVQSIKIPAGCTFSDAEVWQVIDESGLRAGEEDIPTQPLPAPDPNWELINEFRASPVFARAFGGGNESLAVINAFTLLRDSFTAQNVNDLRFSFNRLRVALAQTQIGDFSAEELSWIQSKLDEYFFDTEGFNLEALQ